MTINQKQKLLAEQEGQHKYYCRRCRKGFSCTQAFRVHMRNHDITDEPSSEHDEETTTTTTTTTTGRKIFTFSGNPRRRRTSHVCRNYGNAFFSSKSFLEHSRCCSLAGAGDKKDDRNDLSRPSSSRSYHTDKQNRSGQKRNGGTPPSPPYLLTELEEDAANGLVMLSATRVKPVLLVVDREESSASTSKEVDDGVPSTPLPQRNPQVPTLSHPVSPGKFKCKDCKKSFASHQALGGHRASHSHMKVKGCFAARLQDEALGTTNALMEDENNVTNHNNMAPLSIMPLAERLPQPSRGTKSKKMHECSICKREFSTGQALGGHKRSHRIASNFAATIVTIVEPTGDDFHNLQIACRRSGENLNQPRTTRAFLQMFNSSDHHQLQDLNLPVPMDDLVEISLRLDEPVTLHLQPGWDDEKKAKMNDSSIEEEKALNQDPDEDAESTEVDLAMLWDLEDDEERSTWLQVGIGSMTGKKSNADRL